MAAIRTLGPGRRRHARTEGAEAKIARDGGADLPAGDLGSGSDYTPFVQHLGIASINLAGYAGEGRSSSVYHSAYDTFEHFSRFSDPGFAYSVVLAKTVGRLVLRAAGADLAPFPILRSGRHGGRRNLEELKKLVTTEREHAEAINRLLDRNAFTLADDPTISNGPPEQEEVARPSTCAPLDAALDRLKASAAALRSGGRRSGRAG